MEFGSNIHQMRFRFLLRSSLRDYRGARLVTTAGPCTESKTVMRLMSVGLVLVAGCIHQSLQTVSVDDLEQFPLGCRAPVIHRNNSDIDILLIITTRGSGAAVLCSARLR